MSYSKKTGFYEIPYMGYGDMLTEEGEKLQLTIIDNLLYAATFGASKCIIEDGKYQLQKDSQNKDFYRLKISPYDGKYSALGILNYRLYLSDEDIYSEYMLKGEYYYVFLEYNTDMEIDPQAFNIRVSIEDLEEYDVRLKICEIDLTGQQPILIEDVNKVLAKNILAHTQDTTNPHGQRLTQKNISVVNELKIDNQIIYPVIYDSVLSQGTEGVVWFRDGYKPKYVTVYSEQFGAGQIIWYIQDNSVVIKNSGNSDIKLNLRIEVQKK